MAQEWHDYREAESGGRFKGTFRTAFGNGRGRTGYIVTAAQKRGARLRASQTARANSQRIRDRLKNGF